jgi:hypothetical protein
MAAVNDDNSIALYGELIANFRAAYAVTQEAVKSQGTTIVLMQGQMQAMQQYCMGIRQQTPLGVYTSQQQQRGCHGMSCLQSTGGRGNPAPTSYQQPEGFPGGQRPAQPPTPFKTFKNWNYCHAYGREVDNNHTGMLCHNPDPAHIPNAMRTNMMGGLTADLHRMIPPSASGRVPPAHSSNAPSPLQCGSNLCLP